MKYPTDAQGDQPNCGVTAVATIAGKTVAEVFTYMKEKYGKRGHWKGRTQQKQVIDTLRDYGFTLDQRFIREGKKRGPQLQKQAFALNTIYLVWTTGHVQVVFDDKVYDQSGEFPMHEYWGRRKFIVRIMEVS